MPNDREALLFARKGKLPDFHAIARVARLPLGKTNRADLWLAIGSVRNPLAVKRGAPVCPPFFRPRRCPPSKRRAPAAATYRRRYRQSHKRVRFEPSPICGAHAARIRAPSWRAFSPAPGPSVFGARPTAIKTYSADTVCAWPALSLRRDRSRKQRTACSADSTFTDSTRASVNTCMPRLRNTFSTSADTSSSSRGAMRGSISTRVTSAPKERKIEANSNPTAPPSRR